jgi:hypothetical protein
VHKELTFGSFETFGILKVARVASPDLPVSIPQLQLPFLDILLRGILPNPFNNCFRAIVVPAILSCRSSQAGDFWEMSYLRAGKQSIRKGNNLDLYKSFVLLSQLCT